MFDEYYIQFCHSIRLVISVSLPLTKPTLTVCLLFINRNINLNLINVTHLRTKPTVWYVHVQVSAYILLILLFYTRLSYGMIEASECRNKCCRVAESWSLMIMWLGFFVFKHRPVNEQREKRENRTGRVLKLNSFGQH